MKRIGLISSLFIFGFASLLLIIETRFLIPFLVNITQFEVVIIWFIVAGFGIFIPLLIAALLILKNEGAIFNAELWTGRLRFKKLDRIDWLTSIASIILICLLSGGIMKTISLITGSVDTSPSFMEFEPLRLGNRYWILLLWVPYWILNIMGEEILWRGVLLPRQEIAFGKSAWLLHGLFWGIFHIAFGWQLLLTLLPILFIQSYVVQKRGNSWVGVIIHAAINGPSFIAISLGLI